MGQVIFTLGQTLEKMGISKNRLAVKSEVRPATIASIVNGEAKRIEIKTLTNIIDALIFLNENEAKPQNRLQKIGIEDVITYKNDAI